MLDGLGIAASWPTGRSASTCSIIRFLGLVLDLREGARVSTLAHRHTNCCVRYSSSSGQCRHQRHDHDRRHLRPAEEGGTARARLAVPGSFQAFSEGKVLITTRDPAIDPRVDERMLSDNSDFPRMRDGVQRLRDIGSIAKCRRSPAGSSTARPAGRSRTLRRAGARRLDARRVAGRPARHGTCRMGAADDPRSVVDPECRVIGCTGLRVIDASIMPTVVRANTHLTTVMIAEKMADRLKQGR
ncbi:MAG: GMC family oxidoreductase [Reyranellaceae bacterium]